MISNVTSTYVVSAPAQYQPAGRQAVGQESEDLKSSSFRPTEQLAASSRQQNRRPAEDNPAQGSEQSRVSAHDKPENPVDERRQRAQKEQRESEQKIIEQLSSRDRDVRAHEQAHAAVGGQYAGSPTYTYQRGPDGMSYAIGGEVSIDTSPIPNDPEATLRKAEQIARAAHAPADPSGQDRAVAAQAAQMAQQARVEISQKTQEKMAESRPEKVDDKNVAKSDDQGNIDEVAKRRDQEQAEERALKEQQQQADRQAERSRVLAEIQQKNTNTSRRLLEINSYEQFVSVGRLVDKSV